MVYDVRLFSWLCEVWQGEYLQFAVPSSGSIIHVGASVSISSGALSSPISLCPGYLARIAENIYASMALSAIVTGSVVDLTSYLDIGVSKAVRSISPAERIIDLENDNRVAVPPSLKSSVPSLSDMMREDCKRVVEHGELGSYLLKKEKCSQKPLLNALFGNGTHLSGVIWVLIFCRS